MCFCDSSFAGGEVKGVWRRMWLEWRSVMNGKVIGLSSVDELEGAHCKTTKMLKGLGASAL